MAATLTISPGGPGYYTFRVTCEHRGALVDASEQVRIDPALGDKVALSRLEDRWRAEPACACDFPYMYPKGVLSVADGYGGWQKLGDVYSCRVMEPV